MSNNNPRQYSFISKWMIDAPIGDVWETIYESEQWPQWWKGVVSVVETTKGDENGIGSVRVYKMRSPMLYTLSFNILLTERLDHVKLIGTASGELSGTGAWYFSEQNGKTIVQCHWYVASTLWWMNMFAFALRPAFEFNHRMVMQNGAKSLAKKLNTEVLIIS
jgi:hypothetical protein